MSKVYAGHVVFPHYATITTVTATGMSSGASLPLDHGRGSGAWWRGAARPVEASSLPRTRPRYAALIVLSNNASTDGFRACLL